ncbi:MAG: ABC transporter permease, partial [Eubacteriales bacterium]
PLAYCISRSSERQKKVYMILLMLPMWTNLLIRTYSMMAILDDGGFLNALLRTLDLAPVHIVGTKGAVIFGMVYDFFPYMVLPIYTAITKIDHRLIEAAADLGCNSVQIMTRVILPLSRSGIVSGITMVFVPSISTFYISQKLGGGTFELIGDTIERQFQSYSTYNIGAAISLVMMILILISLAVMNRFSDTDEASAGAARIGK